MYNPPVYKNSQILASSQNTQQQQHPVLYQAGYNNMKRTNRLETYHDVNQQATQQSHRDSIPLRTAAVYNTNNCWGTVTHAQQRPMMNTTHISSNANAQNIIHPMSMYQANHQSQ